MDAISFLQACVAETTGLADPPVRAGQRDLTAAIAKAFEEKTRMMGSAPTGSGKGLAYCSVAALRAVTDGERTVISTDSLELQSQLVKKDLPAVARAAKKTLGATFSFAMLKGQSNYLDPLRTLTGLEDLAGLLSPSFNGDVEAVGKLMQMHAADCLRVIDGERWHGAPNLGDKDTIRSLLHWAIEQMEGDGHGDRAECPVPLTEDLWRLVSAPMGEGTRATDATPWPVPVHAARQRAAQASLVVTNHSLLGVQAAKDVPVILSSKTLGNFHNIAIDEAHTLPAKVRDQGAQSLSGSTPGQILRSFRGLADESSEQVQKLMPLLREVEQSIREDLQAFLMDSDRDARLRGTPRKITEEEQSLTEETTGAIFLLLREFDRLMNSFKDIQGNLKAQAAQRRAKAKIIATKQALSHLLEPRFGFAVWAEKAEFGTNTVYSAKVSPVSVSKVISERLWEAMDTDAEPMVGDEGELLLPVYALGVAAVSATLPESFGAEVAIDQENLVSVSSPFTEAFAESAYFVYKTEMEDAEELAQTDYRSKRRRIGTLDTKAHAVWCVDKIIRLVGANQGSALVLAATTANGKSYAAALRQALPKIRVLEQWQQGAVAAWREDHASVLVGTRSLMTGVDAPGDTCSLVVIDRIPRAAANPVDDARVEMVQNELDIRSYWEAARYVYVSDAAQLLTQAVGRLVRSSSDRGMVALLDPRMHKSGEVTAFKANDWRMYRRATLQFGQAMDDFASAEAWLSDRTSGEVAV